MNSWWSVALLVLCLAFGFQGSRGIWEPDEGYYAEPASTMIVTGDWIVPQNDMRPFLEKPPIVFWGIIGGIKLFGWNEWGVRFANACWFTLTVGMVCFLSRLWWDDRTARLAGIIYATTPIPLAACNIVTPDTPLTFWATASYVTFWLALQKNLGMRSSSWKFLLGICLGLGVLSKGPALLLLVVPMPLYLITLGKVKEFVLTPAFFLSSAIFLLLGFSWYLAVSYYIPGGLNYLWDNHIIGRFMSDKYSRSPGLFGFLEVYIPTLLLGSLPWSFCWYPLVWQKFRTSRKQFVHLKAWREKNLFLFLWIAVPLLLFCLSSSRLPLYLLPLFAPLSIVTARCWTVWKPHLFSDVAKPIERWALILFVVVLLSVKGALAFYPTGKDTRAIWKEIEGVLPKTRYEIVIVNHHRHGLGFYSGGNVERVSSSSDPYPTFSMPERFEEELHELGNCSHHHVFLVRDSERHYNMVREALVRRKTTFHEFKGNLGYRLLIVDPAPTQKQVVRLALMGNTGSGDSAQIQLGSALSRQDEEAQLDGILLLGNLFRDTSDSDFFEEQFLQPYASLIKNGVKFFGLLGDWESRTPVRNFAIGQPLLGMNGKTYHSEVFGDDLVECFLLDSNTFLRDQPQKDWLRDSLSRSKALWRVVAMHASVLDADPDQDPPPRELTEALEPLLQGANVHVVVTAGRRIYQRLITTDGVAYFNAGAGGEVNSGSLSQSQPVQEVAVDHTNTVLLLNFDLNSCHFQALDLLESVVDEGTIPFPEKQKITPVKKGMVDITGKSDRWG